MNTNIYGVYWQEYCIGTLYVRDDGKHRYLAHKDVIADVSKEANLVSAVKEDREWGEPIAFFDQMFKNCSRFGTKLEYHNNNYSIR